MEVLYYHGGPGLNSNPEKEILTEKFESKGYHLKCWNEPSTLRETNHKINTEGSFQDYLNSAEDFLLSSYKDKPLIIVGHSFGAQACLYLSKKHPAKIKHILFVSSNLSIKDTDLNTFSFIAADLEKNSDGDAKLLRTIIDNYTGEFDGNTQNGFAIVGQNPRLFDYYWHNKEVMPQFLVYYVAPHYVLDINGYFNVRKTWFEQNIKKSSIPVTAIFGKYDCVVSNLKEQKKINGYYMDVEFYEFDNAAHYPHIEKIDLFMQLFDYIGYRQPL